MAHQNLAAIAAVSTSDSAQELIDHFIHSFDKLQNIYFSTDKTQTSKKVTDQDRINYLQYFGDQSFSSLNEILSQLQGIKK